MFIGDIFMLAHAKLKTKRIMTLMAILIAGVSLFYVKNITATFIGFNLEIIKIIGAILLSAPIVSILTLDQLSIKNATRRLKKQWFVFDFVYGKIK